MGVALPIPRMKYYLIPLLFLLSTPSLKSQAVYGTYPSFHLYDLRTCDTIASYGNGGTFGIDPDGLFTTVRSAGRTKFKFSTFDLIGNTINQTEKIIAYPPLEDTTRVIPIIGHSVVSDSVVVFSSRSEIFVANIYTEEVRDLHLFDGDLSADLEYHEGKIYATAILSGPSVHLEHAILVIDFENGIILDTLSILLYENDDFILPGIGTGFAPDCSSTGVYIFRGSGLLNDSIMLSHHIDYIPTNGSLTHVLDSTCSIGIIDRTLVSDFDAATWETHRKVCELQLDLDYNDSKGRAGPHTQHFVTCTSFYPLSDTDPAIWSVDDRSIDSMHIRLTDRGNQRHGYNLHYVENDLFTVDIVGDSLLRVFPIAPAIVTYADWLGFIRSAQLEVMSPRIAGYRTVAFELFAGGLMADAAKSFVYIQSDALPAGPDTTLYLCRGIPHDLSDAPPFSTPGGRWEPELWIRPQGPFFFSDSSDYGTYRYITEFEGCNSDTAVIQIIQDTIQAAVMPNKHDTVYVCNGSSYLYDPQSIPGIDFAFYSDDFSLPSQRWLTPPQTVSAYVAYNNFGGSDLIERPCEEWITFTVLERDTVAVYLDSSICAGDTLFLGEDVFTTTGEYSFSVGGNGCDTTFNLSLTVWDEITLNEERMICPNDTVEVHGLSFTLPGDYMISLPGTPCDTQLLLRLLPGSPVNYVIDTTICAGDSLEIAGATFTTTGEYNRLITGEGCDTIYEISLTVSPEIFLVIDTAINEGDTLYFRDSIFTEATNFIFELEGIEGDCDTTVKLDLDIISGSRDYLARAKEDIRVLNPLAAGQQFQVWNARTNQLMAVDQIEVYNLNGQLLMHESVNGTAFTVDLPPACYFYRLLLEKEEIPRFGKLIVY